LKPPAFRAIWRAGQSRTAIGVRAERCAERLLNRHGLKTLARNFRCRYGEIDLIMRDAGELVFVEVRARGNTAFVSGSESVDRAKRRRLRATAEHYLGGIRERTPDCRFDIVSFNGDAKPEWIRNAF